MTNTNNQAAYIWFLADLLRGDFKQNQLLRRLEGVQEETKESISLYIQDNLKKNQQIILKAELSIKLIKESCTALISAVITGEIDVRDRTKPGDIV